MREPARRPHPGQARRERDHDTRGELETERREREIMYRE